VQFFYYNTIFSNGQKIEPEKFALSDDNKYMVADLSPYDIELGDLSRGKLGECKEPMAEMMSNGEHMYLARYPNPDAPTEDKDLVLFNWMSTSVGCPGDENTPCFEIGSNGIEDDTPRRNKWENEVDHLWLHGFWYVASERTVRTKKTRSEAMIKIASSLRSSFVLSARCYRFITNFLHQQHQAVRLGR